MVMITISSFLPLLPTPLTSQLAPYILISYYYLSCCFSGCQADLEKRDYELVFENFTCAPLTAAASRDTVQNLTCGLGKNLKRRTMNMEMSFKRDIRKFEFSILILLPRKYDEDFVLLNLTMQGCHFLANKNLVTLLQFGRNNLNRYSNYPMRCPLRKGTSYYMRGYRWDMEMLPAFTIETDANIYFHYIIEKQRLISGFIRCRLDVKSNKKINFGMEF